ncbi:MAG: CAP domain-containing protein [Bacteroidia bacterium]|nr:CAP domain-containing protein [Bacteroidia bacterium]
MYRVIIIFLVILCFAAFTDKTTTVTETNKVCLSKEEKKLFDMINAYRATKKLPAIALSPSLTIVAQTHVKDLVENLKNPSSSKCNMHSWSSKGKWKNCCYGTDGKQASCMWSKPGELTSYKGNGYEVAHYSFPEVNATSALEGWKNSTMGHNEVLINEGIWSIVEWHAMGVGIRGNYAVAWFGKESDTATIKIEICK